MTKEVYDFLEKEEGRVLHSYKDSAGIWTIGVGSTMYQSGKRVGPGEIITTEEADALRNWEVNNKASVVKGLTGNLKLNENQIVALVSLTYNIGVGGFAQSSLLRTIKKNPNDRTLVPVSDVSESDLRRWMQKKGWRDVNIIQYCFMKWCKAKKPKTGTKELNESLLNRRLREANLYLK